MGVLPVAVRPFGSTSPRLEPLGNGSLLLSSSSSSTTTTTTLSSSSSTYSNVGFTDNVAFLIPLGIALSTLSLLTFFGNAMVVHAIRTERKLHTVSNMFILSLAIADLIVGLLVMPLSSTYVIFGDWILGLFVCQLWLVIDYTASTASILNLLILSLDRYWSIRSPLKYLCKRTKKRALAMIGIVWMISALWAIPIIGWHLWYSDGIRKHPNNVCETEFSDSVAFKLTTSIANFIVPMTLMVILYYKIYREIKRRGNFSDMNHHIVGRGYSTNTTANCPNKNCINKKNRSNRNKCGKRNNTLTGFEYHQYAGHRNSPSLSPSENSSSGRYLSFKKPVPSPSPLSFTDNSRIKQQQQLQQSTMTTTMDSNKNSLKHSTTTTTTTTQSMTRNQTTKSVLRRLMKSFLMKNISLIDDSNDKNIQMNKIQKSQNSNNHNNEFSVIECSSSLSNDDDNNDVVTVVCPKPIVFNYHHSHHHHHHRKKKNKIQQELDSNSLMAVVTDDYDFEDDDDISDDIVSRSKDHDHHQPNSRDSLEFKDSKDNSRDEEEKGEINDDDEDEEDDDDDEITNISPPTLRDLKLEHLSHDNTHRIRNSEHLFASFSCSSKSINNKNQNDNGGDDRKRFFRDQIFQSISLLSSSPSSTATLKNCDNNINRNDNKNIGSNGDDNVETTTESIGIIKSISGKKRLRPPSIFSSLSSSSSASSTSASISKNSSTTTSTTNPNAPSASCHSSTLSFGSFNNYKKNEGKTVDSDYCDENDKSSHAKKIISYDNQNSDDHHHDFDDNNDDEQFKCDNLVNSDNTVVVVADDDINDYDDDSVNDKNIAYYTQLTLMSLQQPKTSITNDNSNDDSNNNNNNHDNDAVNLDHNNHHNHHRHCYASDADSVKKQGHIDDDVDNYEEQSGTFPGSISLKKLSTSLSLNKIKLLDSKSKFKLTTNQHYSGINVKVEYIDSNNIIKTATINNSCTTTTTTTTMASIIIKNGNNNDNVLPNNDKKRSKSMSDVVTESNHHYHHHHHHSYPLNQHDQSDKLKCQSSSLISQQQQKPKQSKNNDLNKKCSKENNSHNKKKRKIENNKEKIQQTTDLFNHSHGNEKHYNCSMDYDHADDDDQTVDNTRQADAFMITEFDSKKILNKHKNDNNNTDDNNNNHKKIIDEISINSSFSSQTKTINTTTMAMASIVNPTQYHHSNRPQQQQQKHCLTGTTTKTTNRIEKQQQKLLQNVKHLKKNKHQKTAKKMSLSNSLDAIVTSTPTAFGCDKTGDSVETEKEMKSFGINSNQTFTSTTTTTTTTTMTMMETKKILNKNKSTINNVPMHRNKSSGTSTSSSSTLSLELPSKQISLSPRAKKTLALNNNEEELGPIDQISNHDSLQTTTTEVMNLNQDTKLIISNNRQQTKNGPKKPNLFPKFRGKKVSEFGENNVPTPRTTMSKVQMDTNINNKEDSYNSKLSMLKPTKKTQNKLKKNNNKVKTLEQQQQQPHNNHNHHQNCCASKNHSSRFKTFNFSLNRNDNANNNNKNNNSNNNNNNMIPMMSVNDSTTATVSKSIIEQQQQQKQCHCMTSMSAAALHRNELKRVESSRLRQEKKAARQLGVILGAFILCWMPYIITYVVTAYCTYCISLTVHQVTIWLGYLNSFLNPFLYALCNENFKYAFKKMLGRLQQPQHYSNNFDQTLAANTNAGNSFNYGTNPSQKQKRKTFRMTCNPANDSIVVGTTTKTAAVMSSESILGNDNNNINSNNQYNRNSKKAIVSVSAVTSFTEAQTPTNMPTDESNSSLQPKLTTITTRAAINKIE